MQLDVVELLKQVLQWTPLHQSGLNKALLQAAKVGSAGCVKVSGIQCSITKDMTLFGDTEGYQLRGMLSANVCQCSLYHSKVSAVRLRH